MSTVHNDLFGYREQFLRALGDPLLEEFDRGTPSKEARRAAARLAAALGFCRLFGIDLGEDDGTLPAPEALGAAEALLEDVAALKEFVESLPRAWDEAADSIEAEGLCADVLEGRMRIWAGEVALSEAALDAMACADPLTNALNARLDELAAKVDELDVLIQQDEIMFLLSTLVETALLDNWRAMLVKPYSLALPYWLDGTLEDYARLSEEIVEKSAALFCRPPSRQAAPARRAADILREMPLLAMAAEAGTQSPPITLLRWQSPDERYLAEIAVPQAPVVGQDVILEIIRSETRLPADDLAGTPVNLAGIEGVLDAGARMVMSLQQLKEAAQRGMDVTLVVGGETWEELPLLE